MGKRNFVALAVAIAGLAVGAGVANANTIQLIGTSTTPGSPNSVYHFEVELTPNNGLSNDSADAGAWQSGLIILDFPGFVSAAFGHNGAGEVTAAGDWNMATVSTGGDSLQNVTTVSGITTIQGSVATDKQSAADGSATNIVLEYTSAAGVAITGTQRNLIGLDITAAAGLSPSAVIETIGRDTTSAAIGQTESFPTTVASVPVPAAAWMGLSTLSGLGVFSLLRKRR